MRWRVCLGIVGSLGFTTFAGCDDASPGGAVDVARDGAGAPAPDAGAGDVAAPDGGGPGSDAGPQVSPFGFGPSNIEATGIPWAGVEDVTLAGACKLDTVKGQIECGQRAINAKFAYVRGKQPGASAIGVFAMKTLRLESGATLQVLGDLPLVLAAIDRIDILGTIVASAHKSTSVAGGYPAYHRNPSGAGPGGGSPGSPGYYGGGGGGFCGLGGAGAANVGQMPAFAGAHGGPKYGTAQIVPLMGGSSGGGSASDPGGGGGGGAIQLVAGTEIAIAETASISVSGGGARPGGGGGSGGAILIEAPKVSALGTLAANGGGGGIFAGGSGGQDGTATATPAAGENPMTAGTGSAGTALDGTAGGSVSANATSGGGGGAGRIRINVRDNQATLGTKLSPVAGSECVTVGALVPAMPGPSPLPPAPPGIAFRPSNVDVTALATMAVDDLVVTLHCDVDTDKGTIACADFAPLPGKFAFAQATQPGAGKLGVFYARSLRIEPGGELEVRGTLPLVFATADALAVHGAITARAQGPQAFGGGFAAADANGTGLAGGAAGAGSYHGGGGGGYCGNGGAGASPNGAPAAAGGKTAGTAALVPLVGGSSGGGAVGELGGAGGGAVQLISGLTIDVGPGGLIDVAGGGRKPGGGGGSGGAILLEAPTVTVNGVLAANGGGGGVFAGGSGGQDGRSSTEAAGGELAQTGGKGSASGMTDGEAGISVTANATSGGGGGAGYIRVNTADGNPVASGISSPGPATGCFTTGKISS